MLVTVVVTLVVGGIGTRRLGGSGTHQHRTGHYGIEKCSMMSRFSMDEDLRFLAAAWRTRGIAFSTIHSSPPVFKDKLR